MSKVYVYESDSGMDIFLSPRKLTESESYCSHCDRYVQLLAVTEDVDEMIKYFPNYGYTSNTSIYKDLIEEFNEILGGSDGRFYSKEIK